MIGIRALRVWLLLSVLAVSGTVAFAQTTTGTILGEVKDATGARMPGVTIIVTNQANGATREGVSDATGSFSFPALPPGLYTLKASLTGFAELIRADLRVAIASQLSVPVTLEVGGLNETVTVTEQSPLIDISEQAVRTLVETKQIASLPLKTRDVLDLAMLSPGVVSDQGSASGGQTDSISFGGMSENYKSMWLEGVDFNDEVTGGGSSLSSATRIALAQEAVQEFQVMANSYSAEFGRSASGAINILTKSGGNNVHGSGFYFLRDDAFDQPNYFADVVPPFKIEQYGATVGGPIIQNKLFYFGSWERRANNRSVQVNIPLAVKDYVASLGYDTRTDVPVTTDEHNLFAKGTYLVSPRNTFAGTYMYDHRDLFNQQMGGDSAGDHGYDDQRRAWFFVGNLTSIVRSNLVNELRVSASYQALDRVLPSGSTSKPEIRFPTVQFGRASNVPQSRTQENYIITNATTMTFVAKGTHDLKVGFEMNKVPTTSKINQSFNGLFEFLADQPVIAGNPATLPFRFTQGVELRGELAELTRDVDIYSTFINDQWRPTSGLTVNIGLRYDFQFWRGDLNGQDIPSDIPIEQFWIRQITGDLKGQNFKAVPNDRNNIAPRLGLTWDPTNNGRTVVRAGYGIYYDQINTTTLRGVVAGYPGFITTQIANDSRSGLRIPNDFFPNLPTQPLPESVGSAFRISSDSAESPYTHQMTAGATHQLGANYAVNFDYVYMRGEHFPLTRNVNARQADGTFPLLPSGLRLLLYDDASPIRIHQAQVRLQRRFTSKLGFLLGYTLGTAKTIADNGTPSDKYDLMKDWGATANDVRHRFVTNVVYEMPWGIQVGGIVTTNSAPPYNVILGTDVNRDGDNNDRPEGEPYNGARGDLYFQTDLRLSKRFNIGRGASAELLWEMYNLFNTVNFNNFQGNMSAAPGVTSTGIPTGFGRPRQAFDPFQGQLGFKLIF